MRPIACKAGTCCQAVSASLREMLNREPGRCTRVRRKRAVYSWHGCCAARRLGIRSSMLRMIDILSSSGSLNSLA